MILNDIFENLEKALISDMNIKIKHNLEDGKYREYLIKNVLSKIIPAKYSITNGFIIDSDNNRSKEMDVIIYDKNYVPPFFDETYTVVPIEAVVAVIQVKTTLTSKTLRDAIDNLKCIDKLNAKTGGKIISANDCKIIEEKRYIMPYKIIISAKSSKITEETITKHLKESVDIIYNIDESQKLYIKNKEVKGIVNKNYDELKESQQSHNVKACDTNKLLLFSLNLLDKLKLINNSIIINYGAYMEGVVNDAD